MQFARQLHVLGCRLPRVSLRAINTFGAYAEHQLASNNQPISLSQLPQTATHEDIIDTLRHDGAVIVKSLIPYPSVQKSLDDVSPFFRPAAEPYREGDFFQAHTSRATALFARSPTYVHDQLLHPAFRAVYEQFLTTEASTGEGEGKYTLHADPLLSSAIVFRIDPGARAQELHRDDVIHHNFSNPAITAWKEPRDLQREASLSMFVAATPSTKANGATRLIPRSHLWDANHRVEEDETVPAEMQPGDALFMLSSCYHGGSENRTQDETRIVFASTIARGIFRQEENQYLSTPMAVVAGYPEEAQRLAGFRTQFPGLGWVDFMDPMVKWAEKRGDIKM